MSGEQGRGSGTSGPPGAGGEGGSDSRRIRLRVNGSEHTRRVEPRLLLSDFLRHELGLTGTHVGCEHGVCGACTVLMDGRAIRSCLTFAVQVDGREVLTVEGLSPGSGDEREKGKVGTLSELHPLQSAFREAHGLQCGFCTPGLLMTLLPFLEESPDPTEEEVREAISGNLCRCTGYEGIVEAVRLAVRAAADSDARSGRPRRPPGAATDRASAAGDPE